MSSKKSVSQKLNDILDELDSEIYDNLNPEKVQKAYKNLYGLGQIIDGSDNFLTFSYTNLQARYQTRLLMTSMIAFLFRSNDEWDVPDNVKAFSVYEYCKNPNIIEEQYNMEQISEETKRDINYTKQKMADRIVVRQFLEHLFQFNPDQHVRSAYRPDYNDTTRNVLKTPAAELAVSCLKFKDSEFREEHIKHARNQQLMNMSSSINPNTPYTVDYFNDLVNPNIDVQEKLLDEYEQSEKIVKNILQDLTEKYENFDKINVGIIDSANIIITNTLQKIGEKFSLNEQDLEEVKSVLEKEYDSKLKFYRDQNFKAQTILKDVLTDFYKHHRLQENKNKVAITTYNMIPPADIFYKLKYYMEANYDALIDAVETLYCEKPGLDIAILPHNWHKTKDEADKYIEKHKSQAITSIFPAQSGKWNIIAPYEKLMSSLVYYNEKTLPLERIMKQHKEDEKISEELVSKRMKIKKRKNIQEVGPESELFKEWRKENEVLKSMNALEVNPDEDDCPPDALEIKVFKADIKNNKLKQDVFYSQAVAPEIEKKN